MTTKIFTAFIFTVLLGFSSAAPVYAQNGNISNISSIRAMVNEMKENVKLKRVQIREEIQGIKGEIKVMRQSIRGFDDDEDGDDDKDDWVNKKVVICHIPLGNPSATHTIKVSKQAAAAHLAHGDYEGECRDDDVPQPDMTAPIISGVSASVSHATATIAWLTNEPADSRLWYSTTTPVQIGSGSTFFLSGSSLVHNHGFVIGNLLSSTTYHFLVSSADSSGNRSTSTGQSFTTSDFLAPVISGIVITHSTTSSATTTAISWSTDENTNATLWFGTTTPLNPFAPLTMSTSSGLFLASHQLVLSDLTPGIPYYFLISASDLLGNRSTTTEGSFVSP